MSENLIGQTMCVGETWPAWYKVVSEGKNETVTMECVNSPFSYKTGVYVGKTITIPKNQFVFTPIPD